MISSRWSNPKPAYLGNINVVVIIVVEDKISHLLRMRQKLPEKKETIVIGKVGRTT